MRPGFFSDLVIFRLKQQRTDGNNNMEEYLSVSIAFTMSYFHVIRFALKLPTKYIC